MEIEKTVEGLIKSVIEENNYILDSVSYLYEDGNNFLRVVIDKIGIIDIDDCVCVSKLINPIFTPLGFGSQLNQNGWVYSVSAITGLIAKENVIATFSVLSQAVTNESITDSQSFKDLYVMSIDEGGTSAAVATARATGISGNGFTGWSVLIAFIVFNMTTIPCFAAVATAKGEVGKKKIKTTILFWLVTSYIASSITYLVLSKWWLSFVFLAAFTLLGFCIYFINKKRDLKEAGVIV